MQQMLQLAADNREFLLNDMPEWTTEIVPFSKVYPYSRIGILFGAETGNEGIEQKKEREG